MATDIEIVAMASLLNTPVAVHTEDRGEQGCWMKYNPVCVVPPFQDMDLYDVFHKL